MPWGCECALTQLMQKWICPCQPYSPAWHRIRFGGYWSTFSYTSKLEVSQKSYSGSATVQQEKYKLSKVLFYGLFGGGSLVCTNFGFGREFIFEFAILVSGGSHATSRWGVRAECWGVSFTAGHLSPWKSRSERVGFDQGRETLTPRGWVLRTALFN